MFGECFGGSINSLFCIEEIANSKSEINVKRILLKCLSPNITETIFCEMIKQGVSTVHLESIGLVSNVEKFLEGAVRGLDIEVLDKIPDAVLIGFFDKEGQRIIKDCIRGCEVGGEARYTARYPKFNTLSPFLN